MARSATRQGRSLTAASTTARLVVVGMTTSRGARLWCTKDRAISLYAVGHKGPDHDAVMRIGSKLRSGGAILCHGMGALGRLGTPPPPTVLRDPSPGGEQGPTPPRVPCSPPPPH